jgi:hypothetical protein
MVDRARERQGFKRTEYCESCFDAYCAENKPVLNPTSTMYNPIPIPNTVGPPPSKATAGDSYCYVAPVCKYEFLCDSSCNRNCDGTIPTACAQYKDAGDCCL